MKECAICEEQLDDHALKCSKGHSRFKSKRGKQVISNERQIVEDMLLVKDMLRQSSVGYGEDEIGYLVYAIIKSCRDAHTPITKDVVAKIGKNIEQRRLERREEMERRQQQQREEMERRQRLLNMDIERALPVFRGFNNRFVGESDLIQLLADALAVSVYNRLQYPDTTPLVDRVYSDNQTFWNDALNDRLMQGMRIRLNGFHLMEWIPSAPGRYFTIEAKRAREKAKNYVDFKRGEYLPLGKESMVLGGIGSIRLGAKHIGIDEISPLCASSTGISHQGIPVILPEYNYRQVMHFLRNPGGCLTDIIGHLKIIPRRELPIDYDTQIQRYFLFVDNLQVLGPSEQLLVTVAITFSCDNRIDHKLWSFCSFNPTRQNVGEAVSWLRDYTLRYSDSQNPFILGDFDENYQHFDNHIEFPLAQVGLGQIDYKRISTYQESLFSSHFTINFSIGEYIVSNQDFSRANIMNIGGQQIVGVGKFDKTIASLNAAGQQEFGQALAELIRAVATSNHLSDQQKKENLEVVQKLGEEAARPLQEKSLVKNLGDGVMTTLRAVPDVAKAATALAPLLARMMT